MPTDPKFEFYDTLQEMWCPLLRATGFNKYKWRFVRSLPPMINVVSIQVSSDPTKCYVNLGVHFDFVPKSGSSDFPDLRLMKEYDCAFRSRVKGNTSYFHQWHINLGKEAARNLVLCYRKTGEPFFDRLNNFPDLYTSIRPADLDSESSLPIKPSDAAIGKYASMLSLIHRRLGNEQLANEFWEWWIRWRDEKNTRQRLEYRERKKRLKAARDNTQSG